MTRSIPFFALASLLCAAAFAQPCEPARASDLPGTSPGSTISLTALWDPDWTGPLQDRLVVAGDFALSNNASPGHIAAWDGTQWQTFGNGLTAAPAAIGSIFGRLIVAGQSVQPVGGSSLGRMAQWNGSTWQSLPGGQVNGTVSTMATLGNWLYVGGGFSAAGTASVANVARWNGTSWLGLGNGLNGSVTSLVVWNSEIIAGGYFLKSGTSPVPYVARWDGQAWQPFGAGPGAPVDALTVYQGKLVALTTAAIRVWDGSQWTTLELPQTGFWGSFSYISAIADKLYIGGQLFVTSKDMANSILCWNGSNWSNMNGGLVVGLSPATVQSMANFRGQLIAGGIISHAGFAPANGLARWTGSDWQSIGSGWSKYGSQFLCATEKTLYAADIAGNSAEWTDQTWRALPMLAPNAYSKKIYSLQGTLVASVDGDGIYRLTETGWIRLGAAGFPGTPPLIEYHGDIIAPGAIRWDGAAWQPMGSALGGISDFVVFRDQLYALGTFTHYGNVPMQGFARWNGSDWEAVDTGGTPNPALPVVYRNELVTLGNDSYRAWSGETWRTVGAPFTGTINAAKVYNGRLFAGGRNLGATGVALAEWTGSDWRPLPQNPNPTSGWWVNSLEVFRGQLFVGGVFDRAGTESAFGFFALSACSLCPADLNNDAIVDDSDFCDFARDYDLMDCTEAAMTAGCPADFNHDDFVDDADFTSFVIEYAAFLCPEAG
ncbi:MAG: hypothetical protein KF691_01285 [Phycisphaeraceae bacterium]|nr:hypothetical protein [Phycisphaeraceae bacterium]